MKKFLSISMFVGSILFLPFQLRAQEIVHALCGTVSSINTANNTITLFKDTGSPATFFVKSSSSTRIAFDKKVADEVTAAKEFQKQGAYVILFYYGIQENLTAVAVKNLGAGPILIHHRRSHRMESTRSDSFRSRQRRFHSLIQVRPADSRRDLSGRSRRIEVQYKQG